MKLFPEALDPQRLKQVITHPYFAEPLAKMERRCKHYRENPIETLPFHLYRKFYIDGDRRSFDDMYYARRGRLSYLALAVLLYHRPEDIQALEDAIWAICEEFSWVLPAHTSDFGDRFNTEVIDLFSAETGSALSEIIYLLGDELDPRIVTRARECIEDRIFRMYMENTYTWEHVSMNWASVFSGCVGIAFMYCAPERFPLVHDRLLGTIKTFMKGFGEDGICLEGIHYWGYGFGYFTYFAQLLYEFTDGKENLFDDPICQKTAFFQEYAFLRADKTVSFSDGERNCQFLPGLTHFLHRLYGSAILPRENAAFSDHCHRFCAYLRNFLWVNPEETSVWPPEAADRYFPTSQWYISSRKNWSMAAKGGHNNEPHNHNDIGTFLQVSDAGQILCDFGAGEYTRDYFLPGLRYHYLCNNSFGHSLPIINGNGQKDGREYVGHVLSHTDGRFCIEMANAYALENLRSAVRTMGLTDEAFTLSDHFDGTDLDVTERFVSLIPPVLAGNRVLLDGYVLENSLGLTPNIHSETLAAHDGGQATLHLIDFAIGDATDFSITVRPVK